MIGAVNNTESLHPEAEAVTETDRSRARAGHGQTSQAFDMPPWPVRAALAIMAVLSLALGVIGVFVPGLPSTVFVLIAAWCAARSSPRLHAWLLAHRLFGPVIRDWQNGGRVSRKAKRAAALAMAVCALVLVLTAAPRWAAVGVTCMALVLIWLWRRPEP